MTDAPDMKIKAIAPWFGGKRTLARRIVAELGPHSSYYEPFCGSMAVFLTKRPAGHECVNDLHGDLINLARVVRDRVYGPMLYRRLRRVIMSEQIHTEAKEMLAGPGLRPLDRAFWYFVMSWVGRNGVSGTCSYNQSYAVRWTPHGGHNGTRFWSAVNSIPAWRRRMARVTILQRDGFEILAKIDDHHRTAIYVDPPYIEKGATYQHDFAKDDHQRLAELLKRFRRARIVVSYYEHPLLDELYPGWTKRRCPVTKSMVNVGMRDGKGGVIAPEVLLLNGPSYATATLFGGADMAARGIDHA